MSTVYKHAVSGLALAAVACHSIPVVEMRIIFDMERDCSTRIESQLQIAVRVDLLDGPQLTVCNMLLPVRRRELYAVAFTELAHS